MSWYKTEFKGVRFRKHPTRRHGAKFDSYFVITYKFQGKTVTESVGWASEGHKASEAFELLCEIKRNQKKGIGPFSLAEKQRQNAAQKAAQEQRQAAEQRRNVSFKVFFDSVFLPDVQNRWKAETTRKAKEHVKNWIDPVTCSIPIRDLSLRHIKRIRANMAVANKSARTQQYVMRTFSMVWAAAVDDDLVEVPCPTKSSSFRLPKVDNERQRYLSLDEEQKLFPELMKRSQQVHDMAAVSLDAGLRFGEIASLAWGCVDLENGLLHVINTKSGRDRLVPMTDRLKFLFESMQCGNHSDLVFPRASGKENTIQRQVPSSFIRAVKDSGLNDGVMNPKLKFSFHSLRHTCASRLVQAGVDLYRVQRLLGHSTPVMTARYSKLADEDLRQAVSQMQRDSEIKLSMGKVIPIRQAAEKL